MLKALLLDLDDTLLSNPMEPFIRTYFQALGAYIAHLVPPERLLNELMRGSRAMETNTGTGLTNEEAFAAVFYPALGHKRSELEPIIQQFYADEFPKLRTLTQPVAASRALLDWAIKRGLQVVVATNPFFPRVAIEQRLAWADVPATEFDYTLITCYENMHATKAHPAYYEEIMEMLGRQPQECLMVGDDWQRDMEPAASVGIPVYWIIPPHRTQPPTSPPQQVEGGWLMGWGTLESFAEWIGQGGLEL
jgi:FMN phosphatase YigB (HAD superfamily)